MTKMEVKQTLDEFTQLLFEEKIFFEGFVSLSGSGDEIKRKNNEAYRKCEAMLKAYLQLDGEYSLLCDKFDEINEHYCK